MNKSNLLRRPSPAPGLRRVEMPECCLTCERFAQGLLRGECYRHGAKKPDELCDDYERDQEAYPLELPVING